MTSGRLRPNLREPQLCSLRKLLLSEWIDLLINQTLTCSFYTLGKAFPGVCAVEGIEAEWVGTEHYSGLPLRTEADGTAGKTG